MAARLPRQQAFLRPLIFYGGDYMAEQFAFSGFSASTHIFDRHLTALRSANAKPYNTLMEQLKELVKS